MGKILPQFFWGGGIKREGVAEGVGLGERGREESGRVGERGRGEGEAKERVRERE